MKKSKFADLKKHAPTILKVTFYIAAFAVVLLVQLSSRDAIENEMIVQDANMRLVYTKLLQLELAQKHQTHKDADSAPNDTLKNF